MAKIIAVQSRMEDIARVLSRRGYRVIDMQEASRPGAQVDAFLFTGYHPDIDTSFNNLTQTDDITLGGGAPDLDAPTVAMLNVVGMTPEHVADILEERLGAAEAVGGGTPASRQQ